MQKNIGGNMKKLLVFLPTLCLSAICLLSTACVPHVHQFDDHCYCKECGFDNATPMQELSNGAYASTSDYYEKNQVYAFNLTGNGKTSYQFVLASTTENATFITLYIYKNGNLDKALPEIRLDEISTLDYEYTFEEGIKYRIEFTATSNGRAIFSINV